MVQQSKTFKLYKFTEISPQIILGAVNELVTIEINPKGDHGKSSPVLQFTNVVVIKMITKSSWKELKGSDNKHPTLRGFIIMNKVHITVRSSSPSANLQSVHISVLQNDGLRNRAGASRSHKGQAHIDWHTIRNLTQSGITLQPALLLFATQLACSTHRATFTQGVGNSKKKETWQ